MLTTTLTLINPLGMHARAASKLVDITKAFSSSITLVKDETEVDAKSIMSLLMLGAPVGSQLLLKVSGDDEAEALESIVALIDAGFHELDD